MSSLRERLKALEELQQIDVELHEVRGRLGTLPARRTAIESRVLEARGAYDAERARTEANERERRQLETLLSMERDKVKKWEGRLGEIRTPREYAALSREIDIARKTNETQSEQIKELAAQGAEIAGPSRRGRSCFDPATFPSSSRCCGDRGRGPTSMRSRCTPWGRWSPAIAGSSALSTDGRATEISGSGAPRCSPSAFRCVGEKANGIDLPATPTRCSTRGSSSSARRSDGSCASTGSGAPTGSPRSKQILAFSRQTDEERMPVRVALVAMEALKFLRATIPATIEIKTYIDDRSGAVLANSVELHQIIMNLCTNAQHAIGEQAGLLEVAVQNTEIDLARKNELIDLEIGSYVRISVKDTGYGMTPDVMKKIFDPYFTTKEKGVGTGLGLAVVHGIVKKYGGTIKVESELWEGTTFCLLGG